MVKGRIWFALGAINIDLPLKGEILKPAGTLQAYMVETIIPQIRTARGEDTRIM